MPGDGERRKYNEALVGRGYLKIQSAVDIRTGQAVPMGATSEKVGDGRRLRKQAVIEQRKYRPKAWSRIHGSDPDGGSRGSSRR